MNHEVAVAYIRAMSLFAWPAVVVTVGVMFRREFGRFIDRTREIGLGGTRVVAQPSRPQTAAGGVGPGSAPQIVGRGPDDPVVQFAERQLRETLNLDAAGDPSLRVKMVLGTAAQISIAWLCERAYSNIFGSQIAALHFLNTQPSAHRDVIRVNYDAAATSNPLFYEHYSFDQWLGFLVSQGLVAVEGEHVSITDLGRIFLQYLVQQRLPQYRPN